MIGKTTSHYINIRPKQQNLAMEIQDPTIKQQVETIVRKLLEAV